MFFRTVGMVTTVFAIAAQAVSKYLTEGHTR
jgi:hypothetical protein